MGARDHGVISQRDTYFGVSRGILKLREECPGRPHLIHYERAKVPAVRESSWRTVEVDGAEAVREVLGAALGIGGVVEKISCCAPAATGLFTLVERLARRSLGWW